MPFSEIPSKVIERAESFAEKKIEIALHLTELIVKEKTNGKDVLSTYEACLEALKNLQTFDQMVPPTTVASLKRKKYLVTIGIVIVGVVGGFFVYWLVKAFLLGWLGM